MHWTDQPDTEETCKPLEHLRKFAKATLRDYHVKAGLPLFKYLQPTPGEDEGEELRTVEEEEGSELEGMESWAMLGWNIRFLLEKAYWINEEKREEEEPRGEGCSVVWRSVADKVVCGIPTAHTGRAIDLGGL